MTNFTNGQVKRAAKNACQFLKSIVVSMLILIVFWINFPYGGQLPRISLFWGSFLNLLGHLIYPPPLKAYYYNPSLNHSSTSINTTPPTLYYLCVLFLSFWVMCTPVMGQTLKRICRPASGDKGLPKIREEGSLTVCNQSQLPCWELSVVMPHLFWERETWENGFQNQLATKQPAIADSWPRPGIFIFFRLWNLLGKKKIPGALLPHRQKVRGLHKDKFPWEIGAFRW